LVDKITTDGKQSWACKSSECDFVRQGNASLARCLKHAISCKFLEKSHPKAFEAAGKAAGECSLGATLEAAAETESSAIGAPSGNTSKRQKMDGQSTLNVNQIREAGKQKKAELHELWQNKVDHVIMRLVCVRGLVPHILDTDEWKELVHLLNPVYHPTSSSTFEDKIIPKEAAFVRQKQLEILRNSENLVLTFDGTSIRNPASFYTAHASTPDRRSFFLDAHVGSDERHTAEWISQNLIKVSFCIPIVQPSVFIFSDNQFCWRAQMGSSVL
jgi:hypothetical protein